MHRAELLLPNGLAAGAQLSAVARGNGAQQVAEKLRSLKGTGRGDAETRSYGRRPESSEETLGIISSE